MVGGESIAMQVHSRYYPGFGGYCKMVVRCSLVFLQGNFSNQHPREMLQNLKDFFGGIWRLQLWWKWSYCWSKKSCTSWQVIYRGIYRVLYITGGDRRISRTINSTMLNCCINIQWMVVISKTLGTVWRGCSRWNLFIGGRKPDRKAVVTAAPSM